MLYPIVKIPSPKKTAIVAVFFSTVKRCGTEYTQNHNQNFRNKEKNKHTGLSVNYVDTFMRNACLTMYDVHKIDVAFL